jgi:hypothetical protein
MTAILIARPMMPIKTASAAYPKLGFYHLPLTPIITLMTLRMPVSMQVARLVYKVNAPMSSGLADINAQARSCF